MVKFEPLVDTGSQSSKLSALYNSTGDLSNFINSAFKFALTIGAILAVLRIAYAGYLYMGQSDMWSQKGVAKGIIQDVALGLLLLLAIWLILNQINPDILKLNALDSIRDHQLSNPSDTQPQSQPGFVRLDSIRN